MNGYPLDLILLLFSKHRMEINHQIPLMHAARDGLELLVRRTRRVVILEILPARKRRHHRDRVALRALVFGIRLARLHGLDVPSAVLR
jgi:hypothetical protein